MSWFVVRTKPKKEFKAQEYYTNMSIETYLAATTIKTQSGTTKKKILLPSYLFTKLPKLDYGIINTNPYTADVLKLAGKIAEISENEIDVMQKHLSSNYNANDFNSVEVGDLYKIPHGSFSGFTGEIVQKTNNKIQLLLPSLGVIITLTINK